MYMLIFMYNKTKRKCFLLGMNIYIKKDNLRILHIHICGYVRIFLYKEVACLILNIRITKKICVHSKGNYF